MAGPARRAGTQDDLGPVPENARVARYIPYERLLPHADVVISNGGYGGVQETLRHGVPMILAGETEDKKDVTAQAAFSGAAINLKTARPTRPQIRTAVEMVLSDPSYRGHARRLADQYAAHDPFEEIVASIEQLAAR